MMPSPAISLVFVNYHSVWSLSLALKSLFSLEKEKGLFEVIVVNNDPREYQALLALSRILPFQLLHNEINVGFGQAANQGAAVAQGRILGFINPDVLWQESVLSQVREFFEERNLLTILGFTLVTETQEEERFSSGRAPQLSSLLYQNLFPQRFLRDDLFGESVDWVSGCGLFLPQKTFFLLKGFNEDFFLYFEDVDLCLRAKQHHITVVRDARFRLLHRGGKSFSSRKKQKTNFYSSQITYFRKHRPKKEYLFVRFFHFLRQVL
jgi:N-acetylglucosaminyl-diphospho-decaprenol L-rhamnosyltransferase